MNDSAYVPRRRPLTWPKLDAADRPDAAALAEQRRAAGTHRNRRAKPRATTPKRRQKMTDREHETAITQPAQCPECAPSDSVEFTLSSPGVWVLESAARTPPEPREPCPRCGVDPTTTQTGASKSAN